MDKDDEKKREIKAIILDNGRDFGRCPLASRLPAALWPVIGQSAIERLLSRLSEANIQQAVICYNEDDTAVRDAIDTTRYCMDLKFSTSTLPAGTAGSIRDAVDGERDCLLLIFPTGIVNVPDIDTILCLHDQGGCPLTVFLNPSGSRHGCNGEAAGIYVCDSAILDYIPEGGYYDIKESLIPEILRKGKNIYAARLPEPVGNFRNYSEYLSAVSCYLETCRQDFHMPGFEKDASKTLWKSPNSHIDGSAGIYGPVVVMENARIMKDAVVLGPAIIGRNVIVGEKSLVANSTIWDDSQVGPDCQIQESVISYRSIVRPDSIVNREAVVSGLEKGSGDFKCRIAELDGDDSPKSQTASSRQEEREPERLHIKTQLYRGNYLLMAAAGILCVVFIWSNWFGFKDLWEIWQRSDEYSSGLLVPFLAAYVLWSRRERFACCVIKPTLWGLLLFVAAKFMKFFGLFFMYSSLERLSIVVGIAGLLLLLFGWSCFRKAFSILLFLCLMLPLPASVHQSLLMPLQSWSTSSAVFCLEMMGYDVVRMGNVIDMNGTTVAVIEACNGLRMIIAFFVIGGFITLLSRRSRWERLVVFISCVPIALVCNTIRLTITAIAFTYVKGEYWEKLFHDFGGYAMMPLAIAIIVFEFWLLEKIVIAGTANQSVSNQRSGVELY